MRNPITLNKPFLGAVRAIPIAEARQRLLTLLASTEPAKALKALDAQHSTVSLDVAQERINSLASE